MLKLTKFALGSCLALALEACTKPPQPPQDVVFKRQGAGLYSAAAFMPAQITGDWRQAAVYAPSADPGCQAGALRISQSSAGLSVAGQLCLDGRMQRISGPLQMVGPGRLAVPGQPDWWVIWVDVGYRTMAIATPSGRMGFVLDRGAIPYDRLNAAREIFDFNGYPREALRSF